ncbi:MAG: GNAT family N-acetyltransferase [Clostridium sp.]|nr:GNAT family N-acetyltransferase [Clostridium sp.]
MMNIIWHKEPVIETERLILRPLTSADAKAVTEWCGDDRVSRFMSYTGYDDVNTAREWIGFITDDKSEWTWGIVLKENGKVIGSGAIGPDKHMPEYWGIGYNIRYDCWNRGYTTEAMKAVIAFARNELGVNKICACHAIDNPASGKVMEKCGLKFHHYDEYSKLDKSETFKAKYYTLE